MVQTIKSLIAPLIMMAVLALLPACWGLKRPSPVTSTIEPCTTNPFQSSCGEDYEIERIVKITECITGDAAATPTCAGAVAANTCLRDPFVEACATDNSFAAYVDRARNARATYCAVDNANATLCASFAGSVQFDMACLDSPLDAPAHPTCASRPSVIRICADDPFTQTGCGNIPTIEMLRIAHCEDSATAWDDDCVEATYTGAEAARNTACLTHGIDANAGGHADCAMRDNVLRACSETSPFALPVCDAVGDIIMKRTTFCLKTSDNGGANPFNEGCEQDTHGDVNMARDTACLASLSADTGCEARITQTCTDTPLAGVSCAGLDGHLGFLDAFCIKDDNATMVGCEMTPAALCSADPFGVAVTVRDGTTNCLMDDDYDSDRQALCASGGEGSGNCDTAVIAPAVCASSGANANPFATFCTGASNIGGGNIVAIRQAVVDLCLNSANASMAVCVNTDDFITGLETGGMRCELAVHAFTNRCVYTQYESARRGICTTAATSWNNGCNGESITGTETARNQQCINDLQGDADELNTGSDMRCAVRSFVIGSCPDDDLFAYPVCKDIAGATGKRQIFCRDTAANGGENPFHTGCTDGTYSDVTNTQRDACLDNEVAPDGSCADNMLAKAHCETNGPLSRVGCVNLTEYLDVVNTYCTANGTEEVCNVVYTDWTGSTFTPALATAPATGDTANRFLSGLTGATAVPTTDFTPLTTMVRDGHTANASPYLNLADTEHGFGGQAEDGVMFFGGQLNDNSYRYYAGIYSSTDLGAPLTEESQNAVWQAWMRTSGKDPENEAFELTVSFTAKARGTLKAFFQSTSGTNTALYYNIDGRFGINGVITGTVAIGVNDSGSITTQGDDYTLGDLTGLIGAEGVVAAFVSRTNTITNDGGLNPFVGGFVAAPLVTYADWNLAATPDAALDAPIANQFLQDIATNGGGGETSVTLENAQYNSLPLGGEAADGFAYKTAGTSPDFVYYVGLLPTTNLGLPLVAQPTGTWNGSFLSIENGTAATPADFILTVTFGGADAGYEGSVASSAAIGDYSFTGQFDVNGVIAGTVTHADSTNGNSTGPLQGLIGAQGAVGVFISNAGTQDFGGGFVARRQP